MNPQGFPLEISGRMINLKLKTICAFLGAALAICFLCSCNNKIPETEDEKKCTKELFAMDTYMTVTAYGEDAENAVNEALDEIRRLDTLLSTENNKSEIYKLNSKGSARLSPDSAALYEKASRIYTSTNGAYDITVYPLMKLWGFIGNEPALPDPAELKSVTADIGQDRLSYNDGVLTLGKNQGVDLGGIAKGYTGDRIMKIFEKHNISSGVISLGGNVHCYKTKPDGEKWNCGINDPDSPGQGIAGSLKVENKAVITSGGYERYFTDEKTGKKYHHIMDPRTGYSAESGLLSVTIISSDGALADGLSTACFVMGKDKAAEYWRGHSEEFDMIMIDENGEMTVTEGIKDEVSTERKVTTVAKES